VLGSASLATSESGEPADRVTDEQVQDHLSRFPSDSRLSERGLRDMVHYQLSNPRFRDPRLRKLQGSRSRAVKTTKVPAHSLNAVLYRC